MNKNELLLSEILPAYAISAEDAIVEQISTGLINLTWKISIDKKQFILQRINTNVFAKPELIAENISAVSQYLTTHHPQYVIPLPLDTVEGEKMLVYKKGYYRLIPFVPNSHTINAVATIEQAYEAALQFGTFTRKLIAMPVVKLHNTIPDFHNLTLRYKQFLAAINTATEERLEAANETIVELKKHVKIVEEYDHICKNPTFKLRVTHHDTKISNVLFDANEKGLCVIDLDTIMPGYLISDVGDMMRTYLCPVSEEEKDFSKIEIREEFYKAIVSGYKVAMTDKLTAKEEAHFFYAGSFIIYMQALRFLTDFLENDIYYGGKYPNHNLVRAQNQTVLLQKYLKKQKLLESEI